MSLAALRQSQHDISYFPIRELGNKIKKMLNSEQAFMYCSFFFFFFWVRYVSQYYLKMPELHTALTLKGKALTEARVLMTVLFTVVLLSSSLPASCSRSLFSVSAMAFSFTAGSGEFKS